MNHTYLEYTLHDQPCYLVLCDDEGCDALANEIIGTKMLCEEHAEQHRSRNLPVRSTKK